MAKAVLSIALAFFLVFSVAVAHRTATNLAPVPMPVDDSEDQASKNYFVVVNRPTGVDYVTADLQLLAPIVGSIKKAEKAIIYHYRYILSGFSARLTQSQLYKLKKDPRVVRIMEDEVKHLDSTNVDSYREEVRN